MTTPYTPVPGPLPATITLPQDVVDDVVVGTVNPPIQDLANCCAALDKLQSGGTLTQDGTTIWRTDPGDPASSITLQGNFRAVITGGGSFTIAQTKTFAASGDVFLADPGQVIKLRGDTELRAPLTQTNDGKIVGRNQVMAAAGNQSVVGAQVDLVYIPSGVMANGDTITIDDTGGIDGMSIRFSTQDPSITVVASGGPSIPLKNATGFYATCEFTRVAGVWQRSQLGLHN